MAEDDYQIEDQPTGSSEIDELFAKWVEGTSAPPIPMPERFNVRRGPASLAIERRWYGPQHIFTLIFGIIWNLMLLPFVGVLLFGGIEGFTVIFGLFLVPFFLVGIGMLYYSVAGFRNITTVAVEDGMITVTHRPLHWPGEITIPAAEVRQLFTREVRHSHHSGSRSGSRHSAHRRSTHTSYTYSVFVVHGSEARERTLVSGLTDANQGHFIEYTIERFLGITDVPITGEVEKE